MNFTGGGNQSEAVSLQEFCPFTWARGIHEELIYVSAFNMFLSITAVVGNILILVALRKVSSIGHVRYINIQAWLRGFRVKIANF